MSITELRSPYLDLKALAALEHKRFATRHRIEGHFSGRHRSRQLGGAGEFVDYREYSAGEDLRRLDWRVLARTGRPYVKIYQDETNLVCTLLLDASRSMLFGAKGRRAAGSKLEYAQYLLTALSHVISRGRDQVGLAVVSSGLQDYYSLGAKPSHVARVQEAIATVNPQPETRLSDALQTLFARVTRRGVLLIASDFLVDDAEEVFAALRLFRHRQWEVVLLHLVHPDEERLPDGPGYRFEGLEDEGHVSCTPAQIRQAYEQQFAAHLFTIRSLALATGCDYRLVTTAVPYLETLGGFLVERTGY